jgi:redox-sensitive bicupin YhaK (pirin superfamily)
VKKDIVEVIAGEYGGVKGPATTFTPIHAYNARLKKDAKLGSKFSKEYNTGLLDSRRKCKSEWHQCTRRSFCSFKK